MEVVLLVGLAVGVDYSLFYMRREREERAAGRSEGAALEAAAATSGRAVLVSGITVLIAMAGMFLSGDKTFMSFSVGDDDRRRRRDDRLAHRPAGHALGKLGDKVEKGRIPFVHRLPPQGRRAAASGARSSTASSGARSSRRSPRAPCCVALALPALQLHTAQTGIEGITQPGRRSRSQKLIDAFPGTPEPAVVAIKADDVNVRAGPARRSPSSSGRRSRPAR